MKNIFVPFFLLIIIIGCGKADSQAQKTNIAVEDNYTAYAELLNKYVEDGKVNYSELKINHTTLDSLIISLEKSDLNKLTQTQKLAFYINSYNMITLKSIVDAYPVKSIKDINGVWDKKKWVVGGNKLTLNDIEHEILRKEFSEPRIHFALVCASIGCPPLLEEPFLPNSLEDQLTMVSENFAANRSYNKIDIVNKTAMLSSIFDWFGEDFIDKYYDPSVFSNLSKKENASLNFVISQFSIEDQKIMKQIIFKIEYLDYDWSLNDRK